MSCVLLLQGLGSGVGSILKGVGSGVALIVTSPFYGAKEGGVAGAIKGILLQESCLTPVFACASTFVHSAMRAGVCSDLMDSANTASIGSRYPYAMCVGCPTMMFLECSFAGTLTGIAVGTAISLVGVGVGGMQIVRGVWNTGEAISASIEGKEWDDTTGRYSDISIKHCPDIPLELLSHHGPKSERVVLWTSLRAIAISVIFANSRAGCSCHT